MMEAEMDEHLGYEKSERSDNDDSRNVSCEDSATEIVPVDSSVSSKTPDTAMVAQESQTEILSSKNQEEAEIVTPTPEGNVTKFDFIEEVSEESPLPEVSAVTDENENNEEYIHPINPVKQTKLPSEQKLREMISRTGDTFRYLTDKLAFYWAYG